MSTLEFPDVSMVRLSVVHASGAAIWTNGGRRTRRGAGNPVRPPAVWVKVTDSAVMTGSRWMSGNATAAKAASLRPMRIVDTLMCPWPE
jgi:hypothetical protein